MKRPELLRTLSLLFAAASITVFAPAGEDRTVGPGPRPGLEVFDGGMPVRQQVSRYPEAEAEAEEIPADGQQPPSGRAREGQRDNYLAEPVITPQSQQPPYRAPDVRRPLVARPRPADEDASREFQFGDPFANLNDGASYDDGYGYDEEEPEPPPAQMRRPVLPAAPLSEEPVAAPPRPAMPQYSVLDVLNTANPYFPRLGDAVRANSLPGASQIIWNTLRQRQAQGVYGYSAIADPMRVQQVATMMPSPGEDPLLAAQRVNVIIDGFQSQAVNTPGFAAMMPPILTRLHGDIFIIQHALATSPDDGAFLELSRTYVRALTTCDFFAFPGRQIAMDVRQITQRTAGMFYPDGSSRGGDVGGITGNLFHMMFMLDRYSQGDGWFKRDIGPISRALEYPGSFLASVACPDGTLPNFGPRGTRELQPIEVKVLEDAYPRLHSRQYRIGLAGTRSFPYSSKDPNYSGVYVMRDNDGRAGRYLALRCGPMGTLAGVPAHADFGSLVLMSRRVKYLADPGGYGGDAATPAAHGGLSLDGQYVMPSSYTVPGQPSDTVWRTNSSIDYATDSAVFPSSKIWQRGVLYVKDLPGETRTDYWVVLDHVDMQGTPEPSRATIRFPMAPGIMAQREGPGVVMTGSTVNGTAMRVYAVDAGVRFGVSDAGRVFDVGGGMATTPAVTIDRELTGSATTGTIFYPADDQGHRPLRIERDSDIIRGRTGVIVVDHGMERIDVIAWAPPKTELVTPTLNLQMSADLGVFRIRRGKLARVDFVNLERFQAKEPDGGLWSMKVNGPAQSVTIERQFGGGWQILSDPDNRGAAHFEDVNLGPTITGTRFTLKPGELRPVW